MSQAETEYNKMEENLEIWKPVIGYEGLYEISSLGRVRSVDRYYINAWGTKTFVPSQLLSVNIQKRVGYPCVSLTKNGKRKSHFIHKLIAMAFLPNPNNLPCVNHKDENRANSVLENLEWCSYQYNSTYNNVHIKTGQKKHDILQQKGLIRSVCQYDMEGNLINTFPGGIHEIKHKYGISIKGSLFSNGQYTCHGYIWLYSGVKFDKRTMGSKGLSRRRKMIKQLDSNGNVLAIYQSTTEASQKTGLYRELFRRTKPENGILHIKGMCFSTSENKDLFKYKPPCKQE